jgi:D-aspartate ligase
MTPAIVVGSGLGALGTLRLLRRAGIPAYSLPAAGSHESRSRWFRPVPGLPAALISGVPLAEMLERSALERAVLIPCSDAVLHAIAQLPSTLAQRFPSSTPPLAAVRQLANKAEFAHLLQSLDVPRPRTLVVTGTAELEAFAGGDFERLFLKPTDSASFIRRYGVKGCRVRDLADARAQLAKLQSDGVDVVVQEYVPGPPTNHYLIDGFAQRGGQIRALFARRRLRMAPPDFGDSSHMVSVPIDAVEPAVHSLHQILGALNYRGIFSAEFKQDARDGAFRILEVNARVWIYVEFAGRCGVDVCSMAYRDALGLELGAQPSYRCGVRLVAPYIDIVAARYAWQRSQLTSWEWLKSWTGAQQPHFNWTDPAPAVHEWSQIASDVLRRLVRGGPETQ